MNSYGIPGPPPSNYFDEKYQSLPLVIMKTANGFIVKHEDTPGQIVCVESWHVFESINSMFDYLRDQYV